MGVAVRIVLLSVLSLLALFNSTHSCLHYIYIDPAATNDTRECHTSNSSHLPCRTLDYALDYRDDSTCYVLHSDSAHRLTREVAPFENLRMLSMFGEERMATVICDGEGIGLAFINVSDISFTNIKFLYCSAERNSTSKNFNVANFTLYTFNVGLYFYLCADVSMIGVTVSSSLNATGVVMYNTVGMNSIQDSLFTNNSVPESTPGGGGFYVEFSYCVPGDDSCNDQDNKTTNHNAVYTFTSCNFTSNFASNEGTTHNSTYIIPYRSSHQAFGRGGGLSVFVKGTASNNTITIDHCFFEGNTAQWGGGLFLEFHDETTHNSVHVSNCGFKNNTCNYTLDTGTGGGGLRIGHYVYNYFFDPNIAGNMVEVYNCSFFWNRAMYGGGLSLSPTLQQTERGNEAIVRMVELFFERNTGKIGAALHVGLFPLLTSGIEMLVFVINCTFVYNNAEYADVLNKADTPHPLGVGTVYINQVLVSFEGENWFDRNRGTALAVVGTRVDFTQCHAIFFKNTGYRGGALALLGSTYVLVDKATRMEFVDNLASDKGGAIFNKYTDMDNLMTQPNCFFRHTDPLLSPDEWQATFKFSSNVDLSGNRNNSIHTTSILPCARAGGNGYTVYGSLCWRGWEYYDAPSKRRVVDCSEQITSEAGEMNLVKGEEGGGGEGSVLVFPGQQFKLPLNITDDYGNDLVKETVFGAIYQVKYDPKVQKNDYFWGGNATVSGPEGAIIQMTFESLGDRIWHVSLEADLLPCPPGLKPTRVKGAESIETVCQCSNNYLGTVSCDPDTLKVSMNDKSWIGKLNNDSSSKYLVGSCPPGFCAVNETSFLTLPNSTKDLYEVLCINNRKGITCGQCIEGYGPAVNSRSYKCVNCTDISLGVNIGKYVASIYLPLAAIFTFLILFDIRLTTGPANAFILYSQVVSSTMSLDANGHVALSRFNMSVRTYNALLKSYEEIYGIFNLEFVENLLSPFCFSRDFSTLTVLSLDYGVALFPLLMIIIAIICLRVRECMPCSAWIREHLPSSQLLTRCWFSKWSVNEALLPAFAAFILLSYTKLSLTSSYILSTQPLINEDGTKIKPVRVFYAGHFDISNTHYRYAYLLPSSIVFATFVCITPLLLLSYPLRLFEWCLSKVRFLRRIYPMDKVHVFLDTFQGCYRNEMRFFAGLYFLFRLVINMSYFSTDSWLEQFIIQQTACIVMLTLVALCRPYVREKRLFNYVDVLIFANLALINSLTFYLYTASLNSQAPPLSVFVLQYILIFLPLLYTLAYVAWYALSSCNHPLKEKLLCCFKSKKYELLNDGRTNQVFTRSELVIGDLKPEEDDEALFDRARATNQYHGGGSGSHQTSSTSMKEYTSINATAEGENHDNVGIGETSLSIVATTATSHPRISSNGYGTMSSRSTNLSSRRQEDKDGEESEGL